MGGGGGGGGGGGIIWILQSIMGGLGKFHCDAIKSLQHPKHLKDCANKSSKLRF